MIKRAFQKLDNPDWSTLMIFNTCITGRNFGKMAIGKAFRELVDRADYEGIDRDKILEHCHKLTKQGISKTPISDEK